MLCIKKDIDQYVQDIFHELPYEHERTLRCYEIAELYFQVGDYEEAQHYLSRYMEVRKEFRAHKLMGQILESLSNKENALLQYTLALEFDGRQEDLILKVCELMVDAELNFDANRAKYWVERAEKMFPMNKIVFQLKEKILPFKRPSNNVEDLENLIIVAEELWPYSLHHQIWPVIKIGKNNNLHSNKLEGPQPNLFSQLFIELYSVFNLCQASPVNLSRLDIDAFLNATALCACAVMEEQQRDKLLSPDRLETLPADLINPLCVPDQEKWWSAAYKMYRKEGTSDTGDNRQHLQHGLEVICCIGNYGLHPIVLVHLARVFSFRAKQLRDKNSESGDIDVLEARSEMYWSAAVPLLERLQSNQTICSSNFRLFEYSGNEMNNMELTRAIEEGKLLLALKLVKDKLYEQAMDTLKALKFPEASFEQGKIYKTLADEIIDRIPKGSVTSEIRSQHGTFLTKAKNCFFITLDRLRGPGADPKHPLNSELYSYVTQVENKLKGIGLDNMYNDRNRNDCDDYSGESYSSVRSDENPIVTDSIHPQQNEQNCEQHTAMTSKLDEFINDKNDRKSRSPQLLPQSASNHHMDFDYLSNDKEFGKNWANLSNTSVPTPGRTPSFTPNFFPQPQCQPYLSVINLQLQGYPPFDSATMMAMSMYNPAATNSDHLPTTTPTTQPMRNVTIPPEHDSDDCRPEGNYDEDYENNEYAEEDDDEENMIMFENPVTLLAQNNGENEKNIGMGNLKVIYDSNLMGARIIIENDFKEIISCTIISINTKMQWIHNECVWSAVDYAFEPPIRRTLKTVFSSAIIAKEMYKTFEEGQECAKIADITDFLGEIYCS